MTKGKLVVIDGIDGAGKQTQEKLLLDYLKKHKIKHKHIKFPQYGDSFYGRLIAQYLKGDFGPLKTVEPHFLALAYAMDRLTEKENLQEWLQEGNFVLCHRYTSANMAFQGSMLRESRQEEFVNWLEEMEYKINNIPHEDIVILFHIPADVGAKNLAQKKHHRYFKDRKKDINEQDLSYQKKVEKLFLKLAKLKKHWKIINVLEDSRKIKTPQTIHQEVIALLEKENLL